ncbi:IclR family transcriptional regulator [Paracoccus sediminicola]|uniref:IclR family transcriptional regulator n=1 Tax=Paracoccus sediminicola TaxID=3017783 RepID=UPI0022F08B7C|nr:IclR family transcriptional regulator [Paracoccus sediminicola]WBU56153.1 IclR family transcriptional regulator [Paracoccus sediminicola]
MATDRSRKLSVPAIGRATALMDLIADEPDSLTIASMARRLGLAKSSVHAQCSTLEELGLLVRNSDNSYAIGPHVMHWSRAFARRSDVTAEFARIWDEGTDQLQGATITLSVLNGNDVVYIGARNSDHTPWFNFSIGMRLPMAFTATGQAFMTRMSETEIRNRFADGLPPPMTPHSPQSLDELLQLVAEARQRGYSIDNQAVSDGMICFGALVLNASNEAVAGVAVSLPVREATPDKREVIVRALTQISSTISRRLGAGIEAM